MREIRQSGSEGGAAMSRSYPYRTWFSIGLGFFFGQEPRSHFPALFGCFNLNATWYYASSLKWKTMLLPGTHGERTRPLDLAKKTMTVAFGLFHCVRDPRSIRSTLCEREGPKSRRPKISQ